MTAVKQDFKKLFLIEYIFLGLLAAAALFFALRNYLPKEDRPEGEEFQTVVLYGWLQSAMPCSGTDMILNGMT